jgi:hypothetical protein
VPEVVTHVPVVLGVAQCEAQPGTLRDGRGTRATCHTALIRDRKSALHDDIRPISAADFDAGDLRVPSADKSYAGEQLCCLAASEPLFR